jgi:AraC-like DNA-binding protein
MQSKLRVKNFRISEEGSSQPGEARIGPITPLPQLLKELGVSPRQVLQKAGIPHTIFDDPENRMSYESFGRMLMVCMEATARADFGLLLGSQFRLASLGELGELMRVSATVREALRVLILNLRYYDRFAFSYLLQPGPDKVLLGYSFEQPAVRSAPAFYDLVTTIAFRILRDVCGPAWKATLVQVSHSQPDNLTPYRRIFGPDVRFDQEISGVLFDTWWLDRPMPGADAARWHALNREIHAKQSRLPLSFSEEVLTVLHQMLATGKTAAGDIANLFGISERTLRHRLKNEGTGVQRLLADTRHQLACHLLLNTNLPISKIAANLGFAESAVFSRAFRDWAGMSPRQWRKVNTSQSS